MLTLVDVYRKNRIDASLAYIYKVLMVYIQRYGGHVRGITEKNVIGSIVKPRLHNGN